MLAQVTTTIADIADASQGDTSASTVLWLFVVGVIAVGATVAVWRSRRGE